MVTTGQFMHQGRSFTYEMTLEVRANAYLSIAKVSCDGKYIGDVKYQSRRPAECGPSDWTAARLEASAVAMVQEDIRERRSVAW